MTLLSLRFLTRLTVVAAAFLVSAVAPAAAQTRTGWIERTLKDADGVHKYDVFIPQAYSADRSWPAVVFLHGAGERGTDNRKQLSVGLAPHVAARASTLPFIVVFPQSEDTDGRLLEGWAAGTPDGDRVVKILDDVESHYRVDKTRVTLTGWSMGGYGAWSLGAAHADRWNAVVALSSGGDSTKVAPLAKIPVWSIHGEQDRLVPVERSRAMVAALKDAGGNVTSQELPDMGHDILGAVYGRDAFYDWLADPSKTPPVLKPSNTPDKVVPKPEFRPAVNIPQVAAIRLGNDSLKALSYSLAQLVPPNLLTGRLNDMYDSTSAAGRSFSVQFSGLSYTGQLERVYIQGWQPGRLSIQLGVRNVVMTIGATYINGDRHSAQAGPIGIYIGQNGPVWLSLDVTPYVEAGKLRLRLNNASFQIPANNYSVSSPAGISTQGFGMTEERVNDGLMSGLYGARGRIENEVRNLAPNIVAQLEKQLQVIDVDQYLSGLWPLPVYQPRVQVFPDQVTVDANGLSLVVGLSAESLDPAHSPATPVQAKPAGASLESVGNGGDLSLAIAPQLLGPLTQLIVDSGLAKLDVLDIPEPSFAKFADPALLRELIPDLKRYGDGLQVRTQFQMLSPLEVGPSADGPLQFRLPRGRLIVSIKTDPAEKTWQPCAQVDLEIQEQVSAELQKPAFDLRIVRLDWLPTQRVDGVATFVKGYEPQDAMLKSDELVGLFRESWDALTKDKPIAVSEVPDLSLGFTRLRIQDFGWKPSVLEAVFKPAGVKLTNLSDEPFTYETKGPYSGWGGPYTVKPGESQFFEIPYPLTYRRYAKETGWEVYTLNCGTHSEFRVPLTGGAPRLFQARRPVATPTAEPTKEAAEAK
jgi:predicted esterase